MKSILHDATPSWNGYNYQGKVGLYVCLVNILKEANKGIDSSDFDTFLNEHHIEYEWIEDFAIKKKDTYLSLHQVKHKAKNNFNDHVEAIATILNRKNGVLPHADIFKYFQFKSKQEGDAATAKKALIAEINKHKLIDTNGLLYKNWQTKIPLIDEPYRDNIRKCFADFEHLSQKAFASSTTYFHTADNVIPPKDDIIKVQKIPSDLVTNLTNLKSLSCQDIFLSFDNPTTYKLALSDDALNVELENQISILLRHFHPETTFSETDVKLYKTALCALIDQNLVIRHQHIRDKRNNDIPYLQRTKPSITFKTIELELKKIFREQNDDYWNLVCRENFESAYKDQLEELYENIKNSNSSVDIESYHKYVIRLEFVRINIIEQYFPYDCIAFLRKVYPHEVLGSNIRQFYEAISERQKIQSVFLDFIQEVVKRSGKLTLSCKNNTFEFQPTCINLNQSNEKRKEIEINKVRKGLIDNQGTQSNIFNNVDYIVVNATGSEDVIPAGIEKFTEIEGYNQSQSTLKDSDNITNKKEVSFMDSRKALGEING